MKYYHSLFFAGIFGFLLSSSALIPSKAMDSEDEGPHSSTIIFQDDENRDVQTAGIFVTIPLSERLEGTTVPAGVFGNTQPVSIAVPLNPNPESEETHQESADGARFRQRTENPAYREEALRQQGITINADNLASIFLTPQELYDRLVGNFHGPRLLLYNASFHVNPKSGLIFDAIKYTQSVRTLALVKALMRPEDYLSLSASLGTNRSLKVLDLTGTSLSRGVLNILAVPLQMHNGLEEIRMLPNYTFAQREVEEFYLLIQNNKGLRLIAWPKEVIKFVRRLAKKGNPVAAVHMGTMYKEGVLKTQNLKKAEKFYTMHSKWFYQRWTSSEDDTHPVSCFELGQIREKAGKIDDALALYQRAADKGHTRAQVLIGDYHRAIWPQDTEREPDYEKAHFWYTKAAKESQDRVAYYRLGRMNEAGRHVPQNLPLAAYYFYLSVERGFPHAFTALANLYRNPDFISKHRESSRYYLMWALKFPDAQETAQKLLNSFDKDTPENL